MKLDCIYVGQGPIHEQFLPLWEVGEQGLIHEQSLPLWEVGEQGLAVGLREEGAIDEQPPARSAGIQTSSDETCSWRKP